jgi:sodium transport system ATP-binding protein
MIQVRHLRKAFGRVTALAGVGFDAPGHSITALLGANGAGKTTTLRAIAGVLTPDAGTIRIGDTPIEPGGARGPHPDLGALLDHQGLSSRLTGREHVVYFARLRGVDPAALDARVNRLITAFGLAEIADRRVGGLSQGQRLKVSLACALAHEPRHLLLDEPTNGLDIPSVRALRSLLRSLRDAGTCIIFSSHVLDEVEQLCDRVVMMSGGRTVAEGTLDDVRGRSRSASLEEVFVELTAETEVA